MARPWFRCYVPPCLGDRRTDASWERHWDQHHRHQSGQAIHRQGGTDVLPTKAVPFVDRGGETATGRPAFLAERRRMQEEPDA